MKPEYKWVLEQHRRTAHAVEIRGDTKRVLCGANIPSAALLDGAGKLQCRTCRQAMVDLERYWAAMGNKS